MNDPPVPSTSAVNEVVIFLTSSFCSPTYKILKRGAGEGWKRSVGPIV
jgi:hypothetical protein